MPRGIQNASAENLTDKRLMLTSEKESLHKNQRVEAFRTFCWVKDSQLLIENLL